MTSNFYGISMEVLLKLATDDGVEITATKEYATDPRMNKIRVRSDITESFDKNIDFDRAGTSTEPEPAFKDKAI